MRTGTRSATGLSSCWPCSAWRCCSEGPTLSARWRARWRGPAPAPPHDAPGNFRRPLELLSPRAARLNRGARGLLEAKPVRDFGYDSLQDLDSEGRWLLTLSALKL